MNKNFNIKKFDLFYPIFILISGFFYYISLILNLINLVYSIIIYKTKKTVAQYFTVASVTSILISFETHRIFKLYISSVFAETVIINFSLIDIFLSILILIGIILFVMFFVKIKNQDNVEQNKFYILQQQLNTSFYLIVFSPILTIIFEFLISLSLFYKRLEIIIHLLAIVSIILSIIPIIVSVILFIVSKTKTAYIIENITLLGQEDVTISKKMKFLSVINIILRILSYCCYVVPFIMCLVLQTEISDLIQEAKIVNDNYIVVTTSYERGVFSITDYDSYSIDKNGKIIKIRNEIVPQKYYYNCNCEDADLGLFENKIKSLLPLEQQIYHSIENKNVYYLFTYDNSKNYLYEYSVLNNELNLISDELPNGFDKIEYFNINK